MPKPRFSILLPTHNRPDTLALAIASVLAQTRTDWELLVVGDGCTDHTAEMMAGYDDPRIRWFDLPKAIGFGYANRNIALREAEGDLICCLGHDNLYFQDHLAKMDAPFADEKVVFCYSRPLFIGNDGLIAPFYVNLLIAQARADFLNRSNVLPSTPIVHRRACFDAVGYWNEEIEREGDWELWKRIFRAFPSGIRMQRAPTSLHFRAIWRTGKIWAPPAFGFLRAMQEQSGWYADALALNLDPSGPLPQLQVWQMMQEDQAKFAARIRYGCDVLEDHLAWSATMNPVFR